jgi:hypothetical protein
MSPSQASVESLSIEVKAIRIDGRKMTIAVFQQLREIRVVVNPNGDCPTIRTDIKPWGYVRHTIKKEGYLWLLAECRGELCRAALHATGEYDHRSPSYKVLNAFSSEILANREQLFIAT